ncbi:MAG: hypothetical protein U0790_12325 [Isosphaeraceae bacterium]
MTDQATTPTATRTEKLRGLLERLRSPELLLAEAKDLHSAVMDLVSVDCPGPARA